MRPIRGVVFDLDGTLVDSLPAYRAALDEIFNQYGVIVPESGWRKAVSFTYEQAIEWIIANCAHGTDFPHSTQETMKLIDDCYWANHFRGVQLFPHAREALLVARELFGAIGLATSSGRSTTDKKLSRFGIADLFIPGAVITADDVERGNFKPHPEPYFLAASRLGLLPNELMAVEDSEVGLPSAVAAGYETVGIAKVYSHEELEVFGAHHTVETHEELALLFRVRHSLGK